MHQTHEQKEPEPLLRRKDVLALAGGITTPCLYNWMKEGRFPRPVRIGKRAVAWRRSDVTKWQLGCAIGGPEPLQK